MITVFNRKEVFVSFDRDSHANARDVLSNGDINYIYRTESMSERKRYSGSARSKIGGKSHTVQYKIYVHKNDRQRAKGELAKYHKEIYNK